jgi:hypothetical protein
MQPIADWLENLGMSEYAARFAENGINVAALPHLTDEDLKDIGVLLGHRRIMLAAIRKLAGAPPPPGLSRSLKTPLSAVKSRSCSRTLSVQRHFRPACADLFRISAGA